MNPIQKISMDTLDRIARWIAVTAVVVFVLSFGMGLTAERLNPKPSSTPIPTLTATYTAIPSRTPTPNLTRIAAKLTAEFTPNPGAVFGAANCVPGIDTQRAQAQVKRVLDAATMEVIMDGETFRIRAIGIEPPDDSSTLGWFSAQATDYFRSLVEGKTVTLVKDGPNIDTQGRLLRYVLVDGLFVNYELLAQGMVTALGNAPDAACLESFLDVERKAQEEKRGLWAGTPTPTP